MASSVQENFSLVFSIASSETKILANKIVSLYTIFFSKIVYLYRFKRYIFEYRCPPLCMWKDSQTHGGFPCLLLSTYLWIQSLVQLIKDKFSRCLQGWLLCHANEQGLSMKIFVYFKDLISIWGGGGGGFPPIIEGLYWSRPMPFTGPSKATSFRCCPANERSAFTIFYQ
jgi:hypothetical protein